MWGALSSLMPPPTAATTTTTASGSAAPPAESVREKYGRREPTVVEASPAFSTTCAAASAAREVDVSEQPVESADEGKSGQTSVAWEVFLEQRLIVAFHHGAAVLPGFPAAHHESRDVEHNIPSHHVVDVELWNTYWCAFSDCLAAHIDDVQEYLSSHANESGRRRVLVAASLPLESQMESFKDILALHARLLGAVEHINRERCIVMLQFTSTRSAEIFAAWASSLTLDALFGKCNSLESVNAKSRLLVRFAPHDTRKVTSTLELGKGILISTPFVERLFKDVFDAVDVRYEAGSFLIAFESVKAAKTALHSLQRSLFEVFGLTLTFSER
ncbi:hypothetical protein DQ04_01191080 [Trypanosoma grayi]|uniref:hypothetical protein n=1 Tax=Trypanosoma grayi TaxID=71804 RepID=UPI0004F413B9|nr:hypothetical protein DQ04_01191080 [Trypanosoma grayi]KEG13140.1 hypothetical protein DQ04_01191080 [Trypanosoma grayi]